MRHRAILIILLLSAPVLADEYRSKINEGYDLYKNGEYDKAAQQFKDAAILKPEMALPAYDKGTALYKSNDFETAAGEFEASLGKNDPKLKADSYFNAGNSYFKAQKYDQAVKSYIDALKMNPRDTDAKHNLEMALVQKQMQQQQQDKQKQDQNKQDQDKKDQNKQDKKDKQEQDKQDQNKEDQQNQQKQKEQQKQQQKASQQKLNEEQAQQLLERFAEDEKDVQKRLKQVNMRSRSTNDW